MLCSCQSALAAFAAESGSLVLPYPRNGLTPVNVGSFLRAVTCDSPHRDADDIDQRGKSVWGAESRRDRRR